MSQVDVIIPTYNSMPYLQHAIQSALSQSFQDIRIFIVDDGSTDETQAYVGTINDERLVYLRKENGGPSSARNRGIEASDAPYVAFLDSDDLWEKEKIERQLQVITEGHGLVYCHQKTLDESGAVIGSLEAKLRGSIFDDLLTGTGIVGSDSSALVRRNIIAAVGGFDERLWFGEDWDLWLRVARKHSVDFVAEYLVGIRVRKGALQSDWKQMAGDSLRVLDISINRYDLNKVQRRRLSETCLNRVIVYGLLAGEKRQAGRALRRLLRESPAEAVAPRNLRRYGGFIVRSRGAVTEGLSHR